MIIVRLPVDVDQLREYCLYRSWCELNVGANRFDIPFWKRYLAKKYRTWMWETTHSGSPAIAFYNEEDAMAFKLRFGL